VWLAGKAAVDRRVARAAAMPVVLVAVESAVVRGAVLAAA